MNISVLTRTNGNGSVTFFRRHKGTEGKDERVKILRTEPHPTNASLREWSRKAHVAAHEFERELVYGPRDTRPPIMRLTLKTALGQFEIWAESAGPTGRPNKAPGTVENITRHVTDFIGWLPGHMAGQGKGHGVWTMDKVLLYHIAQYRDHLVAGSLGASTINCYLASLGSWWSWALDHGHVYRNEAQRVKRLDVNRPRSEVPLQGAGAFRDLLSKLVDDRQRAIVTILAGTGMRQGTLKSLFWSHWCAEDATLTLPGATIGPKRTPSAIYLAEPVTEAIEMLDGMTDREVRGPFIVGIDNGHRALTSQINAMLKPHGLTPHDLRRFFITSMETIGAPARVIDDYVGHSPGKVRRAYTPEQNIEEHRNWIMKFGFWLKA